jgi:hypothetical protein
MTHRRLLIAGLAASAILPGVAGAQAWNQQFGNVAVGLLAQWITASRQQALAAGTEPVPPLIVRGLAGYFQPGLEQTVRWRGTGTTELSLPGLAFQYGDAAAITLIDVAVPQRRGCAARPEALGTRTDACRTIPALGPRRLRRPLRRRQRRRRA